MTSEIDNSSDLMPVERLHFSRQDDGALMLHLDGQSMPLAPPRRMLPLSEPDRFIALFDGGGNELGIIEDVAQLPLESQPILQEALAQAYVIERITRILEVEKEPLTGQTRWRIDIADDDTKLSISGKPDLQGQSTAGRAEDGTKPDGDGAGADGDGNLLGKAAQFLSRAKDKEPDAATHREREFRINGQEEVQTARFPHIYIVDTERNRYEIVDWEALDVDSRRAAEQFL